MLISETQAFPITLHAVQLVALQLLLIILSLYLSLQNQDSFAAQSKPER
jgi:hypothetical protein